MVSWGSWRACGVVDIWRSSMASTNCGAFIRSSLVGTFGTPAGGRAIWIMAATLTAEQSTLRREVCQFVKNPDLGVTILRTRLRLCWMASLVLVGSLGSSVGSSFAPQLW